MAVYVIQQGDCGPVKIGFTTGIEHRLSSLQTASPEPLRVIRMFHGTRKDERRLHASLAMHRLNGEWFKPVPEVLSAGHDRMHLPIVDERQERQETDCPLAVWRKTSRVPVASIAAALETTKQAISRYETGGREPSFAVMHAIRSFTDGAVTPDHWVNWWAASQAASEGEAA
ncbi:MAG: GIY-YIG nuclease family protein [Roseomonas sp.]|nr:GIY-YIG nuclease family protein [Roseomonas sp.]